MTPRRRRRVVHTSILDHLDPAGVTQAAILAELRRALVAGSAAPGGALPVDAIADAFQVSRIPVREALKTLQAEGLVEHQPRGEYTVTRMTKTEYLELYTMRGALEALALEAAAGQRTRTPPETLAGLLADAEAALNAGDAHAWDHHGRRLHSTLIEASRMSRLRRVLESVFDVAALAQPMLLLPDTDLRALQQEHHEMVAAYVAGDSARLLELANRHTVNVRAAVGRLSADLDLFSPEVSEGA